VRKTKYRPRSPVWEGGQSGKALGIGAKCVKEERRKKKTRGGGAKLKPSTEGTPRGRQGGILPPSTKRGEHLKGPGALFCEPEVNLGLHRGKKDSQCGTLLKEKQGNRQGRNKRSKRWGWGGSKHNTENDRQLSGGDLRGKDCWRK